MSSLKKFIEGCLLDAADAIGRERKRGLSIKSKGRNDRATSADMAAESLIVSRIKKEYPGSSVLSEESYTESDILHQSLFVIDPIDGTHNFIQDIPLWGVSIAHFSHGKPTAGGTYLAPQEILLYAEKGKSATANGRRISVSRTGRVEDFFLLCDSRIHTAEDQGLLHPLLHLERISQHTRFLGSAVYDMGYVSMGMAEASLHFKLKPYDFAAAAFIVERAGGRVTDFEGSPWSLKTKRFVSSNGRQHKRLLDLLSGKGI